LKNAYRTVAIVPVDPPPALLGIQSEVRRRIRLVVGVWAPSHLALVALLVGLGVAGPLLLLPAAMASFLCTIRVCTSRAYDENGSLAALLTPSARRLAWVLVLMVPVVGLVAYLVSRVRVPEPSDVNQNATSSG
jgi:hypothetical protein